jgi:hypothetical protein
MMTVNGYDILPGDFMTAVASIKASSPAIFKCLLDIKVNGLDNIRFPLHVMSCNLEAEIDVARAMLNYMKSGGRDD